MLDEKALRKAEWTEGVAVKLGDGQEWTFPKPWMTLFPGRDEQGQIATFSRESFGAKHIARLDEYAESDEDDAFGRMAVVFDLATSLLLRNYDLTDRHLAVLLPFEIGGTDADREANSIWEDVRGVVFGASPKPTGDGFASPSSPTESATTSP